MQFYHIEPILTAPIIGNKSLQTNLEYEALRLYNLFDSFLILLVYDVELAPTCRRTFLPKVKNKTAEAKSATILVSESD
jgi:hypothetical protein